MRQKLLETVKRDPLQNRWGELFLGKFSKGDNSACPDFARTLDEGVWLTGTIA